MFNLAKERPFHRQINIAAAISVVVLLFAPLIQPETGWFGSVFHLLSVILFCVGWAVLARTRDERTYRVFGLICVVICALSYRMLLNELEPQASYWRYVVFTLILVHSAVLFARIADYVAVTLLSGLISFVGLKAGYFVATGYAEFAIATLAASVIGVMMNVIIMSSYGKLYEAKESYKRLSRIDPLTKRLNRRAFLDTFAEMRARRSAQPLHLAMLDLDHFKRINDTYGHERGDAVLVAVADCLQQHAPDMAGRLGGEEFAILLPNCDRAEAQARLEALLCEVRGLDVDGASFTFSAGLVLVGPGEDAGAVMSRADRALYGAKAAGRNRINWEDGPLLPMDETVRPLTRRRMRGA